MKPPGTPARRAPMRRSAPAPRGAFTREVKLATRTRSGHGDPLDAACEGCLNWLGFGGEIQHRDARGMGGSSDPVTRSVINAAHLCGSAVFRTGCHGLCERRDPGMRRRGFWLKAGDNPADVPIVPAIGPWPHVPLWLTPAGGYSYSPPGWDAGGGEPPVLLRRALGLDIEWLGSEGSVIALGHVEPALFAAACRILAASDTPAGGGFTPGAWSGAADLIDGTRHVWGAHTPESRPGQWRLQADVPPLLPGAFPVTVYGTGM